VHPRHATAINPAKLRAIDGARAGSCDERYGVALFGLHGCPERAPIAERVSRVHIDVR
jgi:hypothetical protein